MLLLTEEGSTTGLILSEIPSLLRLVFILATKAEKHNRTRPPHVSLLRYALAEAFHQVQDKGLLFFETTSGMWSIQSFVIKILTELQI